MALLNFKKSEGPIAGSLSLEVEAFLQGYSIEVMPRTASKVEDFRAILPKAPAFMSPTSRAPRLRTWFPQPRV